MIRKTLGEIMDEPAGGPDAKFAHDLAIIDDMLSASRGVIAMLMPPGKTVDALTDDEKALVREAQSGIDKSFALRNVLEQRRSECASIPDDGALAKRAGFGEIAGAYALAKSRFDDAVAGKLGRLNFAEEQRIRCDLNRAEIAMIEARAGR